jgi:hypothetical protein
MSKKCFVIMPISVRTDRLARYAAGADHFRKILQYLIKPAVELADLELIEPSRSGSENIQAGIINDLRESDLVLADLSSLNPNVFLELGIRTALDRPVCLVWDGLDRLPFDTATIHTHRYEHEPGWRVNDEIARLAEHITDTVAKASDGRNVLWKFFGTAAKSDLEAGSINSEDASLHAKLDQIVSALGRGEIAYATVGWRDYFGGLFEVLAPGSIGISNIVQGGFYPTRVDIFEMKPLPLEPRMLADRARGAFEQQFGEFLHILFQPHEGEPVLFT